MSHVNGVTHATIASVVMTFWRPMHVIRHTWFLLLVLIVYKDKHPQCISKRKCSMRCDTMWYCTELYKKNIITFETPQLETKNKIRLIISIQLKNKLNVWDRQAVWFFLLRKIKECWIKATRGSRYTSFRQRITKWSKMKREREMEKYTINLWMRTQYLPRTIAINSIDENGDVYHHLIIFDMA